MKTIDLSKKTIRLEEVIDMARKEPVLLLTKDGKEFLVSEADDFEKEAEALRNSEKFQKFLDERSRCLASVSLEEIEKKLAGH